MSRPMVHVEALSVRYPGRRDAALRGVDLAVGAGEWLGIAGRTGAGKSSLALVLAGFTPRVVRASVDGRVLVDGVEAIGATAADLLGRVGIVFSSPADQLSGSKPTVRDEVAFGLENLGIPRSEMDGRIDAVMDRLGIVGLAGRDPASLSGGEQQRVAIASIVTMGPQVIVLDEPTAELDPAGTAAVAAMLDGLAAAGSTVVCAEHDPVILGRAGRVVVLDAGTVVADGAPADAMRVAAALVQPPADGPPVWDVGAKRDGVTITVEGLGHRYPNGVDGVRDVSMQVRPGEAVAIVGPNGSGKTTLTRHLNGLLRPTAGRVLLDGVSTDPLAVDRLAATVGLVFQDPSDQLFERTVEREVSFGPRQLGRGPADTARLVEAALVAVGLSGERRTNPYDLDRSLRKLVGLASVLATDPAVLVLDEPTTGQDGAGVNRVGQIVEAMHAAGRTVIAVTHDMSFAGRYFGRIVALDGGRIVADGPPSAVLGGGQS